MGNIKKFFIHLKTIRTHRAIVRQWAFKMGIGLLGLQHDLSKYSWEEFALYKYATGKDSPNKQVIREKGYSEAWVFHKNKNRHHWEYWVTFNNKGTVPFAVKIPYKHVIEMFCDMIAAGQTYDKAGWTCASALAYYNEKCLGKRLMHKDSEELLLVLLQTLAKINDPKLFIYWYKLNKKAIKKAYNLN